jgi:hypothetical protein
MTEEEWIAGTKPRPMLEFRRDQISRRKLRLFAIACFRRDWNLYNDERSREAISIGERYADGQATSEQLKAAHAAAMQGAREITAVAFMPLGTWRTDQEFEENHRRIGSSLASNDASWGSAMAATARRNIHTPEYILEAHAEAILLRDICGNPFRPAIFDSRWRTATVTALAQAIYDDRNFDRLPILADALEDAGCTQQEILNHCRGGGEHARGCWAVDLILGKS